MQQRLHSYQHAVHSRRCAGTRKRKGYLRALGHLTRQQVCKINVSHALHIMERVDAATYQHAVSPLRRNAQT
jgi:hypothetical protein